MKEFICRLKKETDARIQVIGSMEADMLKKALEASLVVGSAFDRLKKFIVPYEFKDAA
ncbi:hypothetical protein EZS27_038564, partial [termite gut metagenome]